MDKIFIYSFPLYFAAISLIAAAVTLIDKLNAKKGRHRIPEKVLFILAFLGGAFAEYLTMQIIRHKTQHKSFMIGLPAIIIAEMAITAFAFYHLSSH